MKLDLSKGKFVVFEGGEACGKTTQIKLLKEKLGEHAVTTREPGGTIVADQIREIITTGETDKLLPETELALVYAARNEHVHKLIKPALAEGKIVVCDRFSLSTVVYQGVARGVAIEKIQKMEEIFLQGFKPDITFLLDLDIQDSRARALERQGVDERFEKFSDMFHVKIREGFLEYAKKDRSVIVLDAAKSAEEVHAEICQYLNV